MFLQYEEHDSLFKSRLFLKKIRMQNTFCVIILLLLLLLLLLFQIIIKFYEIDDISSFLAKILRKEFLVVGPVREIFLDL